METYIFLVPLRGTGEDAQDAWEDAQSAYLNDPDGAIPEQYMLEDTFDDVGFIGFTGNQPRAGEESAV